MAVSRTSIPHISGLSDGVKEAQSSLSCLGPRKHSPLLPVLSNPLPFPIASQGSEAANGSFKDTQISLRVPFSTCLASVVPNLSFQGFISMDSSVSHSLLWF